MNDKILIINKLTYYIPQKIAGQKGYFEKRNFRNQRIHPSNETAKSHHIKQNNEKKHAKPEIWSIKCPKLINN